MKRTILQKKKLKTKFNQNGFSECPKPDRLKIE